VRLKRDRFDRLTGKAPPPAPAPVPEPVAAPPMPVAAPSIDVSGLERKLEGLEKMMGNVFLSQAIMERKLSSEAHAPAAPPLDLALALRLSSMEAKLRTLVRQKPEEKWHFSVKRDAGGRISAVDATKKTETD
jgi:hypothetical protein